MNIKSAIGFVLFFLASYDMMAQCNADKLSSLCIPRLGEGFKLLKSYNIDNQNGAKEIVEYSYIFTKGTQYMINLCTEGENNSGITMSLLDSKRNKVASNKVNEQLLSTITYSCATTSIYYIHYTFEGKESRCAGSALGFRPVEQYAVTK